MKQVRIHCPYCGSLATLRPASAIHGLSDISAGTYLYVCRRWPACDAYVTADRRTKQPLGTLANGDLRHKRILAHHALHSVQAQLALPSVPHGRHSVLSPLSGCTHAVGVRNNSRS